MAARVEPDDNRSMPATPLILLPGLMCDHAVWAPQVAALADLADARVAAYGELDALGAMAEAVLANAPERFALAGHSMGGRVALELMRRAPERVLKLALLDTGSHPRAEGAAGEAEAAGRHGLLATAQSHGVRAMAAQWVQGMVLPARRGEAALIEPILDMFERQSVAVFAAQIRALLARPDAGPVLDAVRVPTLVLTGRADAWSPPAQHEAMAARVPGSRLVVVEDAGHMVTMEQPDAVNRALRDWLQAA
jgi:pimeloyl-ACP methyl ester carboxylesterase